MSELAIKQAPAISSMDDLARVSEMFARSGMFKDSKDAAQAGVRILAGLESGFGAFAAMSGVHIIQGKPTFGANLMAIAVKRSGRYNYRVTEHTEQACTIKFYERWGSEWEEVGESRFSTEDAKKAGLMNNPTWKNYPKNMTYARAMSNGVRWYCPDALGVTGYTPEELGANVDADGEVIDAEVRPASEPVQEPKQEPVKAKVEEAKTEAPKPKTITPERAEALKKELTKLGYDVSNEAQLLEDAFGLSDLEHLVELTDGEAVILWQKLKKKANEAAKEPWERWQNDSDAQKWAAQESNEHGIFASGAHLMNQWEAMKNSVDGLELYEEWFTHIEGLKQEKEFSRAAPDPKAA